MVTIVPRAAWGAPPTTAARLTMPTPELWLHHSGTVGHGPAEVRAIRDFHIARRHMTDIAYSFVVDIDGTIYEGRGAGRVGGHTKDRNTISHGVCALGNYEHVQPSPAMIRALADLARYGHEAGWWVPRGYTGGHRDAPGAATACPGRNLHAALRDINALAASEPTPPPPKVRPMYDPPIPPIVASAPDPASDHGVWLLSADGAVYAIHGARYAGGANGKPYFQGRRAARIEPGTRGKVYVIVATSGERYAYPE